jgi:hypothetical protein
MSISLDSCDSGECDLRSTMTWDELYRFLGTRVSYWVRSSHVSLWNGQEEDIIADIVQEATVSTFMYASTYLSELKEGETFSGDSLKRLGLAIAYKQYQQLRCQDSRFRCIQLHRFSSHGYVVIYEWSGPLERTVDSTLQEWHCNRLAEKIAKISSGPRRALLIDLANRVHFDTPRAMPLQRAFLKQGIRLQDYQQSLPNDPQARGRHLALLRCAYEQIMRQREEQENTETIHSSQGPAITADGIDPDAIESDPELTAMAARLDAAAPRAIADPAFRKALQDKLLGLLAEYSIQAEKAVPGNISETVGERSGANSTPSDQDPAIVIDGIDPTTFECIESDLGLVALAACLDATAPPDLPDLVFRKALQSKAEGTLVGECDSEVEWALEMTERALNGPGAT